jgi:CDP-paratose 2-epimerase
MAIAIITGSAGLVGAETVRFFAGQGFHVVGIDNDLRRTFFGEDASTAWSRRQLEASLANYVHHEADIRDFTTIESIFRQHGSDTEVVVHTAAQPSHDWAASAPIVDFSVNANGTQVLLEATRNHCPKACFIFTSTNKVYGDNPNSLPLVECETRWEVDASHPFHERGIDEQMSVDQTKHSLFGASKLAADVLVQEYGRYFGMNTVSFRCGCITGPGHAGTKLHGFLSYLVKCALSERPYTILGFGGKQVRDNIHSFDLVNMFWRYCQEPRQGAVYNAGGGRECNCSILEAIALTERITGRKMNVTYSSDHRVGDHIWYISDTRKFERHYPGWRRTYDLERIVSEIVAASDRPSDAWNR